MKDKTTKELAERMGCSVWQLHRRIKKAIEHGHEIPKSGDDLWTPKAQIIMNNLWGPYNLE